MTDFHYEPIIQHAHDATEYRRLTARPRRVERLGEREVLAVDPEALTLLATTAIDDISHLLRASHLEQLRSILDDAEASANDKFVALELLKNANIAAGRMLPGCQDTGTAIAIGYKGQNVVTSGDDAEAISRGIFDAYQERNLRYSQMAPLDMYTEKNTGTNLPAQIEIYAEPGDEYRFLFIAKGGGSANKTFLYQETKALLNPISLLEFVDEKIRTLGTSACPPYHLALVVGGTSAELTLKTVKLASCHALDDLPTSGNEHGRAFRDRDLEARIFQLCRDVGIGAQFGGKYFAHDVRVIRLPRHGASCPVGLGVSCSADRQAYGKITRDGVFLEQLEEHPSRFLPEVTDDDLGADVVRIDLRPADARDPRRALEASGGDAALAHRPDGRRARHRAREAQGAPRSGRRSAAVLQGPHGLLRRPGEAPRGLRLGLVRPHHRRPHGLLRRSLPEQGRQHGDARQGQPLGPGARRLRQARRLLSGLDRRARRRASPSTRSRRSR